ncbi:glycerophosphodiester phosphodiesterase family protein [Chitinimonas lacunae]|uniref:Glycerophosphodiester phosphodiesterase family protein n=1 Tax=Chitinimonas lacunae TaxID=1963018 RepID=A0ABV8MX78_9NEIS
MFRHFRSALCVSALAAVAAEPLPAELMLANQRFQPLARQADGSLLALALTPGGDPTRQPLRLHTLRRDGSAWRDAAMIELRDPARRVPFSLVGHFSPERVLTAADFALTAARQDADGSWWLNERLGPFVLHIDRDGRLLDVPQAVADPQRPGAELRSPDHPGFETAAALHSMNALRAHARQHGAARPPVFSPHEAMLKYATSGLASNPDAHYARGRKTPAGLAVAASDVFDLAAMRQAGYPVVSWTVNDKPRMVELLRAGVSGLISDRPDLLREAVAGFDADGDGRPGDYLDQQGLIDPARFDAQGHRGARNLRPENTLPALEAALDHLMTTLEFDIGVSRDGVAVLKHDPYIEAQKCRRHDGREYRREDERLIAELDLRQIQQEFVCDRLFRGPSQRNELSLSPVSVRLAASRGYLSPYVMPTLQDAFDLVTAYIDHYERGAGRGEPEAGQRAANARRVRFNIETKLNPRSDRDGHGRVYRERTVSFDKMADAVAERIVANGLTERADIQSFDFRTLLRVQEKYPAIRTVYLFGDFPIYAGAESDDGTNLQDEHGRPSPWLVGLPWPYRRTERTGTTSVTAGTAPSDGRVSAAAN